MTDGTDNPQATDIPDTPPTLAEGLLQASLERPLTASELGQLRAAAEADPAVADDCATLDCWPPCDLSSAWPGTKRPRGRPSRRWHGATPRCLWRLDLPLLTARGHG